MNCLSHFFKVTMGAIHALLLRVPEGAGCPCWGRAPPALRGEGVFPSQQREAQPPSLQLGPVPAPAPSNTVIPRALAAHSWGNPGAGSPRDSAGTAPVLVATSRVYVWLVERYSRLLGSSEVVRASGAPAPSEGAAGPRLDLGGGHRTQGDPARPNSPVGCFRAPHPWRQRHCPRTCPGGPGCPDLESRTPGITLHPGGARELPA